MRAKVSAVLQMTPPAVEGPWYAAAFTSKSKTKPTHEYIDAMAHTSLEQALAPPRHSNKLSLGFLLNSPVDDDDHSSGSSSHNDDDGDSQLHLRRQCSVRGCKHLIASLNLCIRHGRDSVLCRVVLERSQGQWSVLAARGVPGMYGNRVHEPRQGTRALLVARRRQAVLYPALSQDCPTIRSLLGPWRRQALSRAWMQAARVRTERQLL
ncbi:Aste57867_16904 [Aphanomyces stellatus]|uniref:Aste57867_16904 protein n=1 Tax=Aphanomyces stellatus TaxID=120398 RepID=A0A485L7G0_9STRA|nr:hypothetical protein As57867_016846 [Aphanomyces stellatus]VFT93667.1 Aste57867_16904 [Aphanomyces stellatus]